MRKNAIRKLTWSLRVNCSYHYVILLLWNGLTSMTLLPPACSAMHRIFIQAGEIISDAHAPFKPTLLVHSVAIKSIAIKSKQTRIIKN